MWVTQERAGPCWQLRGWSWCVSTPPTGSSLTPEFPHILPVLTIQPQSPASSLAIPWHQISQDAAKINPGRCNLLFNIGNLEEGKPVPGGWRMEENTFGHTICLRAAQLQHRWGQEMSFCYCQKISKVWGLSGMRKMEICSYERI